MNTITTIRARQAGHTPGYFLGRPTEKYRNAYTRPARTRTHPSDMPAAA